MDRCPTCHQMVRTGRTRAALLALLALEPTISSSEAARRLGVSYERVRQLRHQLPATASELPPSPVQRWTPPPAGYRSTYR